VNSFLKVNIWIPKNLYFVKTFALRLFPTLFEHHRKNRMTMNDVFSYEKGIVLVHYKGAYTAKIAQETSYRIINHLQENDCKSLLLHFEDVQMKLSLIDLFYLPRLYTKLEMSRMTKIAVVAEEYEKHRRLLDFYETVCYNLGYQVNIFEKTSDAKQWLTHQYTNLA